MKRSAEAAGLRIETWGHPAFVAGLQARNLGHQPQDFNLTVTQQFREVLLGAAKFVCGALAVVLFMWTPISPKDFLIYGVLVALLIVLAVILFRAGQLSNKWDDKK
jgi:hypothetical protein